MQLFQRARLLDNTERLENSTRNLEIGYRVATETEQIGQDILDNLHRDREKINRTRQRVSAKIILRLEHSVMNFKFSSSIFAKQVLPVVALVFLCLLYR